MSDSEDSIITYTAVFSPFGGLSDIGSLGVGGPPVMPEDPYAYVVAAFQAPPSPNYVSGPEYPPSPEFPLPAAASPTSESPGYIDESDPEDDPEEDPEDDPEEDRADYPADGGDEGDDEDDDIDIEGDEEEYEYLAPANSTVVALPAIDHAPSAEETEPFETDESATTPPPHPAYRVTARMSIRPQTPISLSSDTEIARLMAIPTPLPSPLSLLSSPLPQIPSPPLPLLSPPPTDPTYEEAPLGYRIGESSAAAAARLREPVRDDLYRFMDTVKRGEGSMPATREVGYGITNTWDDFVGAIQETTPTIVDGVNQRGEARASRTAWTQSMDANDAVHSGVIALRTQVSAQQTKIVDLQAADCRFQNTVGTQQEEIRELQTQLTAALGRIQILETARVPAQPE
nr:hypothetical protein [Tanacetum cinerariifolium]GFA22652.1 hypothetical protein [Tanacetum cinerariifolium]